MEGTGSGGDEDDTTSTSFVAVQNGAGQDISKAITPSSTSSKVLIIVTCSVGTSNDNYYYLQLVGSTNGTLGDSTTGFGRWRGAADGGHSFMASFSCLDSPSTTSAETYTIHHKVNTQTGYINLNGSTGYIHLFEIAA